MTGYWYRFVLCRIVLKIIALVLCMYHVGECIKSNFSTASTSNIAIDPSSKLRDQ